MSTSGNRIDADLVAGNIKSGETIFWVVGSYVGLSSPSWGTIPNIWTTFWWIVSFLIENSFANALTNVWCLCWVCETVTDIYFVVFYYWYEDFNMGALTGWAISILKYGKWTNIVTEYNNDLCWLCVASWAASAFDNAYIVFDWTNICASAIWDVNSTDNEIRFNTSTNTYVSWWGAASWLPNMFYRNTTPNATFTINYYSTSNSYTWAVWTKAATLTSSTSIVGSSVSYSWVTYWCTVLPLWAKYGTFAIESSAQTSFIAIATAV